MADEEWFSDEALARQDEIDKLIRAGKYVDSDLTIGMLEPRVPPTPDECCAHCGSDARDQVGGEEVAGRRWCWLCHSREYYTDNSDVVLFTGNSCPRCGGPSDDSYFDREPCPDPCNTMHTRCKHCGCPINGCPLETGRLRRA